MHRLRHIISAVSRSKMSTTAPPEVPEWKPPAKIESLFAATAGNKFAAINSPVAGAREERELPSGDAPVQLYSLFTPNGRVCRLFSVCAT